MGAILVVQEEGTSATWEIADRSGGELAPGGTPQARVNLTGLYCLGCGNRCDVFEFDDARRSSGRYRQIRIQNLWGRGVVSETIQIGHKGGKGLKMTRHWKSL